MEETRNHWPNILSFSIGISYNPMPFKKLNRALWVIGDSDSICKEIVFFRRLTPTFYVHTPYLNSDPLKNRTLYSITNLSPQIVRLILVLKGIHQMVYLFINKTKFKKPNRIRKTYKNLICSIITTDEMLYTKRQMLVLNQLSTIPRLLRHSNISRESVVQFPVTHHDT